MTISVNIFEIGKCLYNFLNVGVTEDSDSCTVYDNLEKKILDIRPRDSYRFGISRSNLISLQKKIRENGVLKLHK